MSDRDILKNQRDSFLAFAFASADLLLEVSENGKIVFATGAAKGLTGIDEKNLIGRDWLEIFSPGEQAMMITTYDRAKPGLRCGPLLVRMNEDLVGRQAIVSGLKMPGSDKFYLTLGLNNEIMTKISHLLADPAKPCLLGPENFPEAAAEALEKARARENDIHLTLFEFSPSKEHKDRIGEQNWNRFLQTIGDILIAQSFDGYAAAHLSEGRYGLMHDAQINAAVLRGQIAALTMEQDPSGQGIKVRSKTITSDLETLDERDAARAIVYTLREFERKGTGLTIETLNSGFESYVAANAQKIKEFQNFIERSNFTLHFQPIVDMETRELSHYEVLSRFDHGNTHEWIMFGEDIGMAPEFDMAVCDRAINHILFKAGGTRTKFSINLSGQSIEDENFCRTLRMKLDKHKDLSERLMFEITESTHIRNIDRVGKFVSDLQKKGYKIALDDFGANASSFQYLQRLNVNYVKIDGKYIRKLLTSQRDISIVKNLAQMCKELRIDVIAEFVEEESQLVMLSDMGIQYGQGYLFGRPKSTPEYS